MTLLLGRLKVVFSLIDPDASTSEGFNIPASRLSAFSDPPSASDTALQALDLLQLGVILVDHEGQVVFANRSARSLLDERDGLTLGPEGLKATDSSTTRALRELVRGEPQDRGGALSLPRRSGPPLALLVSPLGSEAERLTKPRPVKALFLSDPARGGETGEDTLKRLYGLTAAEARLTQELIQGRTLDEAAAQLAISSNTARSQLRTVFSKTGVRRQSELVRLLLAGPAQLRAD
jgi:DNA-binding CsgD family transcriptional regulator